MTFIFRQKIKFIFDIFLEILQRYCEIIFLGTLVMPDYTNPEWYYQFVENFCSFAGKKKQLHPLLPSPFLEILQRYANLCWVLWSWLVAHTQNDIISLQKTSMFICMPKINFSIHFFLEIYILKNPAIWLADSILAHNSRTRILPDMGLVVKYQQ